MEIFVVDVETTARDGYPKDVVVEIAICKVDTKSKTVEEVYNSIVGHDVESWDSDRKHAWIFDHSTLELPMVASAKPEKEVVEEVRELLKDKCVTSFNVPFDFSSFLRHEPWKLDDVAKSIENCIMHAATDVCRIESPYGNYKWPTLEEAYEMLCKGNPAKIEDQTHRALDDTLMASHVLLSLIESDNYFT